MKKQGKVRKQSKVKKQGKVRKQSKVKKQDKVKKQGKVRKQDGGMPPMAADKLQAGRPGRRGLSIR